MPNVVVSTSPSQPFSCSTAIKLAISPSCYKLGNELLFPSIPSSQWATPVSTSNRGGVGGSSQGFSTTTLTKTTTSSLVPATHSELALCFTNTDRTSQTGCVKAEAKSESSTPTLPVQEPGQVVIVDDNPLVLTMLEDLLSQLGYRVKAFSDGQSFLNWVASWEQAGANCDFALSPRLSLILMDIQMPGVNGFEVAALLKANPAVAEVPVVLMSGNDAYFSQIEVHSPGLYAVLAKPFKIRQLCKLLPDANS